MHAKKIPTNKYAQRSIADMARDLAVTVARSPDAYIPITDFPTLEFEAPKRRRGPLILALLLFVAGGAAAYYANRPTLLAIPTCDQRVTECGR
jgi:hypothetical protein